MLVFFISQFDKSLADAQDGSRMWCREREIGREGVMVEVEVEGNNWSTLNMCAPSLVHPRLEL